ncbi:dinucleotide-utilizing enzyme [Microbacterium sp. H37-C3]|uniref:dinucleotide-utilizing enzyme n=1 Tax=Microbacterium sp. H37-C3 TaxID=3004354 RepID=UPI0022AE8399|nr:dinucleotide-utilizing enzyme [Microbacterium sp. H37-C3]MCZ4066791.1 dinucleotide-utilizing enzyme [Microbacterium sp. H37-C3]
MSVHPRIVRSIPFWILVAGSVAAIGGGTYILVEKLSNMEATILDNTATGVDVYVGQIWGVFGGILLGAGVVGLALALATAALSSVFPREPRRTAGEQDRHAAVPASEHVISERAASEPAVSTETTAVSAADTTAPDPATTSTLESPSNDPQQR